MVRLLDAICSVKYVMCKCEICAQLSNNAFLNSDVPKVAVDTGYAEQN